MFNTLQELEQSLRTPESVLSKCLNNFRPMSNGWGVALCPFHDDSSPSFSIHLSSGNWRCHGCNQTGGFAQIPKSPAEPFPTHVYKYTEDGVLKYVKVRYFPKTFRIFGVDGDEIKAGRGNTNGCLYGWDRIKNSPGDVFVVEGEKDCDALHARGILSVTGGSSSEWKASYSNLLHNRRVYLLPDSDPAGKEWVKRVCLTLKPIGVVSFPDPSVKDVSEWFEKGNQFKNLIVKPPEGSAKPDEGVIDLSTYKAQDAPPCVIKDLVPKNLVTVLYGDGGEGKSYLSLMWAHYLAIGKNIGGLKVTQSRTLYVDWELNVDEHKRRADKISNGLGLSGVPEGVFYRKINGPILKHTQAIKSDIETHNIQLVIVDAMAQACAGDMNNSQDIVAMFEALLSLGVTVLVIDHQPKPSMTGEALKPFGSVYKHNLARSVIKLVKVQELENGMKIKAMQTKSNLSKIHDPVYFTLLFDDEAKSVRLE